MEDAAVFETLKALEASVVALSDYVGGGVWPGGAAARGTGALGATSGAAGD